MNARGVAAMVLLCCTLATGCAAAAKPTDVRVAASFYPLAYLAREVGGDHVSVTDLTPAGAEPHDLELRPSGVAAIKNADLVLYLSGRFQPSVEDAVDGSPHGLDLKTVAGSTFSNPEGEGPSYDPHFWLDPLRMIKMADAVADKLAARDPAHASDYRHKASALDERLMSLDGEYRRGLASCSRKEIVTGHAAFGYLAARYGLRQIPIAGVDPEAEPSAGQMAAIVRVVKADHVTTVFAERLVSPKLAQTIARESGATVAVLDPIEGVRPGSGDDYIVVMRRNLAAVKKALDCA